MSNTTHGLTYSEIASKAGIPRCRGIRSTGLRCYLDHERGLVADGLVHWKDRRVTRSGIKRFLMAGASMLVYGNGGVPGWYARYRRLQWVHGQLARLHILLPRAAWAEDRDKLRAMIARAAVETRPEYVAQRREALRWTKA